jgi:hypothetical protein
MKFNDISFQVNNSSVKATIGASFLNKKIQVIHK